MDVEFSDPINPDLIPVLVQNIADALRRQVDNAGLAPEDAEVVTNKVRIMCKDVVLLQEDYTKLDGQRHLSIEKLSK